jgi:hypothetical protein
MSKNAFDKIAEGLGEALAIARGEAVPYRLHVPAEIDETESGYGKDSDEILTQRRLRACWAGESNASGRLEQRRTLPPLLRPCGYYPIDWCTPGPQARGAQKTWPAERRNRRGFVHTRFGLRPSPVSHAGRCVRISSESLSWSNLIRNRSNVAKLNR